MSKHKTPTILMPPGVAPPSRADIIMCRGMGHRWVDFQSRAHVLSLVTAVVSFRCERCYAEKHVPLTIDGRFAGSTQRLYPPGWDETREEGRNRQPYRRELAHKLIEDARRAASKRRPVLRAGAS